MADLTSPQAGRLSGAAGLVPLGSVEQHGPHLPLATDTLIAERLAAAVAERVPRPVVVAPVITGGLSAHHLAFPGTVTLQPETFGASITAFVEAFGRCGIDRVALISAHGGNFAFMAEYAAGRRGVVAYSDLNGFLERMLEAARRTGVEAPETDVHAGGLETALALHLFPEKVAADFRSARGYTAAEPGWLERIAGGIHELTDTGVLGDPSLATAELGQAVFEGLCDLLADWLEAELGAR